MCVALASKSIDRCHPVPLANSEYSTKTAHLLRDAFGPLHYVLSSLHSPADVGNNKGKYTIISFRHKGNNEPNFGEDNNETEKTICRK